MRILFTGASSFTGMWFAEALAGRGHAITAVARREQTAYSGLRAERLARVGRCCRAFWNAPFGSPLFLKIVSEGGPFDVFCHHGAETTDYKSCNFDCAAALAANTKSLVDVLRALREVRCKRLVLTGSIFEAGEGAGTPPLDALNAYGLSKTMTSEVFGFFAAQEEFALGKFVIANTFGPYEEPRFTDYLIRSWQKGETPVVRTPLYVRDNIHVSLLAEIYCTFVATLPDDGFRKINPSGYIESQKMFAVRFAREIGERLKLETPLEFLRQRTFEEPAIRINTDIVADAELDWDEDAAWDQLADHYAERLDIQRR